MCPPVTSLCDVNTTTLYYYMRQIHIRKHARVHQSFVLTLENLFQWAVAIDEAKTAGVHVMCVCVCKSK